MNIESKFSNSSILDALKNYNSPCVVNAGPGSGKTRFLCYKLAYLLINKLYKPSEIIVCTFTEKAAEELKLRIKNIIQEEAPELLLSCQLNELRIGTIHSVFLNFIEEFISYSRYKSNIRLLSDFERKIFIHKNLSKFNFETYTIPSSTGYSKTFFYLADYANLIYKDLDEWEMTDYLCGFFDALVDVGFDTPDRLHVNRAIAENVCIRPLFNAYFVYKELLLEHNYIDFNQILQTYWEMLQNVDFLKVIRKQIKYIMVDEYQDTNYIQERALLETIGDTLELCNVDDGEKYGNKPITIVGDINQSLYRFRGATIDNILTFNNKFSVPVSEHHMFINYRSTENIINLCNEYIYQNLSYYQSKIGLNPKDFIIRKGNLSKEIPILKFVSSDRRTTSFVQDIYNYVCTLRNMNVIHNLSDVAILLPSIRYTEAMAFKDIFDDKLQFPIDIEFFNNNLVKSVLSQFLLYTNITLRHVSQEYKDYISELQSISTLEPLVDIESIQNTSLVNLCYQIVGELQELNTYTEEDFLILGILTQQLSTFTSLYQEYDFESFFTEYLPYVFTHAEDIILGDVSIESDKVKIMTIHQSKGLEFPIVVVGFNKSITKRNTCEDYLSARDLFRELSNNKSVEDNANVSEFELRRLFYVAFSRAKHMLLIGSREKSKANKLTSNRFNYQLLSAESTAKQKISLDYESLPEVILKPRFSYTADIETYNLCPQMYEFSQKFGLVVPNENDFAFGKLVHKAIENLNRVIIRSTVLPNIDELIKIAESTIDNIIESTFNNDKLLDQKKDILYQVKNYLMYFYDMFKQKMLYQVEAPITYETEDYVLNGRIDIVFEKAGRNIIVDVKSGKKSNKSERDILNFEGQLNLYGSIYSELSKKPYDLLIYSTGERHYKEGEYRVPIRRQESIDFIDSTIRKILNKDFCIDGYSLKDVCPKCPFVTICKHKSI